MNQIIRRPTTDITVPPRPQVTLTPVVQELGIAAECPPRCKLAAIEQHQRVKNLLNEAQSTRRRWPQPVATLLRWLGFHSDTNVRFTGYLTPLQREEIRGAYNPETNANWALMRLKDDLTYQLGAQEPPWITARRKQYSNLKVFTEYYIAHEWESEPDDTVTALVLRGNATVPSDLIPWEKLQSRFAYKSGQWLAKFAAMTDRVDASAGSAVTKTADVITWGTITISKTIFNIVTFTISIVLALIAIVAIVAAATVSLVVILGLISAVVASLTVVAPAVGMVQTVVVATAVDPILYGVCYALDEHGVGVAMLYELGSWDNH